MSAQPIRLGVIGCGSVVREIYQHLYLHSDYSDLLEIAAVADPNEEFRAWFGDLCGLGPEKRFASHAEMLAACELDAVQVNTPDHLHAGPAVDALRAGLDVVVPKPLAATVADGEAMVAAAREAGRLLLCDYHKREDPRIKEAAARFRAGRYGVFQLAVWYMLDKLLVADPNHEPRFFADAAFAERNTPVSFLTVHMTDALLQIIGIEPVAVQATGFAHRLPALRPKAVRGYDMVDTEIRFAQGGVAHIVTGWHLPNTAHATTVQSGRIICSEGLIDLDLDRPGFQELHGEGLSQVNPLFRNFKADGSVGGYGIDSPGQLYRLVDARRRGNLPRETAAELLSPIVTGLSTTRVLEAAERSLADGEAEAEGVTRGPRVDLNRNA